MGVHVTSVGTTQASTKLHVTDAATIVFMYCELYQPSMAFALSYTPDSVSSMQLAQTTMQSPLGPGMLALEMIRVTEAAAIAAARVMGRGERDEADHCQSPPATAQHHTYRDQDETGNGSRPPSSLAGHELDECHGTSPVVEQR